MTPALWKENSFNAALIVTLCSSFKRQPSKLGFRFVLYRCLVFRFLRLSSRRFRRLLAGRSSQALSSASSERAFGPTAFFSSFRAFYFSSGRKHLFVPRSPRKRADPRMLSSPAALLAFPIATTRGTKQFSRAAPAFRTVFGWRPSSLHRQEASQPKNAIKRKYNNENRALG